MHTPVLAPRLKRNYTQRICATPERIFPLLCPEAEKAWLPGWEYTMIHSTSGVAEHGAVFETPHARGRTLWVVTEYEAPRRIAFVRWQPDDLVVHIEIVLDQRQGGETPVSIAYTYTASGPAGAAALAGLTEEVWLRTMTFWEESMNRWFRESQPAHAHVR
jgi:hypothetical protein